MARKRGKEDIKYFMSSGENRTHNSSRLQPHVSAAAPPVASFANIYII